MEIWSRIYQVIYLLGFFLIPVMFAHLCARFPRPNFFVYFKKNRVYWLYLPPSILMVPAVLINWLHYADVRAMQAITKLILIQGFVLWAAYLIAGNLMLIRSFLKVRSRILSRRCVAVFYSLALAISPYLLAGAFEIFGKDSPSFTITSQILFLPFPLSLAWAIDYGDDKSEGLPWVIGRYLLKND